MEYEQIKKLMEDVGNSKLSEISIEFPDGVKISMKKDEHGCKREQADKEMCCHTSEVIEEKISVCDKLPEKELGNVVKSPMVGTFYAKPSPESEPYVCVGQKVKKGDILCVIEAMKLLNEIESEFDGVVEEILVSDGEMVDFDKPLFRIV